MEHPEVCLSESKFPRNAAQNQYLIVELLIISISDKFFPRYLSGTNNVGNVLLGLANKQAWEGKLDRSLFKVTATRKCGAVENVLEKEVSEGTGSSAGSMGN